MRCDGFFHAVVYTQDETFLNPRRTSVRKEGGEAGSSTVRQNNYAATSPNRKWERGRSHYYT